MTVAHAAATPPAVAASANPLFRRTSLLLRSDVSCTAGAVLAVADSIHAKESKAALRIDWVARVGDGCCRGNFHSQAMFSFLTEAQSSV